MSVNDHLSNETEKSCQVVLSDGINNMKHEISTYIQL